MGEGRKREGAKGLAPQRLMIDSRHGTKEPATTRQDAFNCGEVRHVVLDLAREQIMVFCPLERDRLRGESPDLEKVAGTRGKPPLEML